MCNAITVVVVGLWDYIIFYDNIIYIYNDNKTIQYVTTMHKSNNNNNDTILFTILYYIKIS